MSTIWLVRSSALMLVAELSSLLSGGLRMPVILVTRSLAFAKCSG
jgi:hypothetical protein